MKGFTPPKKVSLQKVREELEKAKAPSLGASESDSGFENKSSSSETELNKKKLNSRQLLRLYQGDKFNEIIHRHYHQNQYTNQSGN